MPQKTSFNLVDGTLVQLADPFFIVGSGRCGTTLMRRLIIEQTSVVIPPENYVLALSSRVLDMTGVEWNSVCKFILDKLRDHSALDKSFGIEQESAFDLLSSIPREFQSIANFWHGFHAIYANLAAKPAYSGWGDKTPANFDALPEIIRIFPRARFIFMVRDVFDMAFSYGSMLPNDGDFRYLQAARRWIGANSKILAFCEENASKTALVRYEDLVNSPGEEIRKIIRYLDIPMSSLTELNAFEIRDMTAQAHLKNALEVVNNHSVGKGRAQLQDATKTSISNMASALQTRLGYEPTGA